MTHTSNLPQNELEAEERNEESSIERARQYFHDGNLEDARNLHLKNLETDLTADECLRTLLGLFSVEWTAGNMQLAREYILRAKDFAKQSTNEELVAAIHNNYALLLRHLADTTGDKEHLDLAIIEYTAACFYYEQAGNVKYHAITENNLAFLFLSLERYEQALEHANESKRITERDGDPTRIAYAYDTIAQIYFAMNRLEDAYSAISQAAAILPKSDNVLYWFDVSGTYARILFRLENFNEGKKILDDAIKLAEDLNQTKVVAQLTLLILENCEQILMPLEIVSLHQKIFPMISEEKDLARLAAVSDKFYLILNPDKQEKISFSDVVDRIEKETIRRALINAKGSITRAAEMSGISYQRLQARLENRYLDLNKMRTPTQKRRRRKSIIKRK